MWCLLYFNYDLLYSQFCENDCDEKSHHNRHCNFVEREDIFRYVKLHYSSTYGVNRRSALAQVKVFDVTDQLLEDVMHILFEGVCMLHTSFVAIPHF